jgi:hypothetical protein
MQAAKLFFERRLLYLEDSMVILKDCTIFGDMTAERSSEAYPEVPVCEECIAEDQAQGENAQIVTVNGLNTDPDATCEFCDSPADAVAGDDQ